MLLETNLNTIAHKSVLDALINDKFVAYLKQLDATEIDEAVYELDSIITPQIDCTQCGNCCKTLMINVEEPESKIAAHSLSLTQKQFEDSYIEKSLGGRMVISKIPCHFLEDNKCNIYLNRFSGCREFPALHLPQIQKRLFTVFMHYGRCPIIFNVMEQLKVIVKFEG
ncbi:MAG: YkgJ family cysteine cluster protein [Chitinophagaceae bacterium]